MRGLPLALVLGLAVLLDTHPGSAQQLRRTDVVAEDDLASTGLASDSLCTGKGSASPGGFDPLEDLSGARKRPIHLAAAATGSVERLARSGERTRWRGGGHAQLRGHYATQCRFDLTARAIAGSGGGGGDAVAVVHWPGALGGALHAFAEVGLASDSTAADRLDVPRGAELGAAYTTFNLLELVPVFRSPTGRPRLDVRARLSAGALMEYAGDARRVHGKSIVPEYGLTTGLVVHEKVNLGLLYTARAIPGYIAPALRTRGPADPRTSGTLWEQSVVLEHAILGTGESWLARHEPFVGARYGWRRLGGFDKRHELALHGGIHID